MRRFRLRCAMFSLTATLAVAAGPAVAQLRVVTYNTATGQYQGTQTARPATEIVLEAIGLQNFGGVAKPIDVLMLQEQYTTGVTTQSFADMLNDIYDPVNRTMYARSFLNGQTSDPFRRAGAPALVYNTQTVQLVDAADDHVSYPGEKAIGNVGGGDTQQGRSTMRYKLRPVGYDSSADFFVYSSHWISDTGTIPNSRRLAEATAIRNDANAQGEGASIIYGGDYNIQSTGSEAYQQMLSAGAGQASDPLNLSNASQTWNNNSTYKAIHTQSPATVSQFSGQTLGGMDDRFDFQLVTGELLDNEGMSLITGTYRAFGNGGQHSCCNSPVTASGGPYTAEVQTALMQASDHLPVVADYQLPARMGVEVATIPLSVTLGASVTLDLTVENTAFAVGPNGADELDYTLDLTGAVTLLGPNFDTDPVNGGGHLHQFTLDTSTPGLKNGLITIAATSPQAANALFTLPVSYLVTGAFLEADFDGDGLVDAGDLATWSGDFGIMTGATKELGDANGDAAIDGADLLIWQQQLGAPPPGVSLAATVPEPSAAALAVATSAIFLRRRRLR